MPLEIVKVLNESARLPCDIEYIDIYKDRLFTTGESGKIQIWTKEDLRPVGVLDAHQSYVCCIAVQGNKLYAGTSGGNIVVWDIEKSVIIKELNQHQDSVLKIRAFGDLIVSGDNQGKVLVWERDKLTQLYETCEEVWDMELTDDHLYSLRDRDLVVQVIYKSDRGNRLKMVRVVEGRSPMCRVNNQVILLSRNGMDINILEDDRAQFPLIGTIKGQDRMINALACIPNLMTNTNSQQSQSNNKSRLYSGGWDCTVRSYDLATFTPLSRLELGHPVNCIRPDPSNDGQLYVGGNQGLLCKLIDS